MTDKKRISQEELDALIGPGSDELFDREAVAEVLAAAMQAVGHFLSELTGTKIEVVVKSSTEVADGEESFRGGWQASYVLAGGVSGPLDLLLAEDALRALLSRLNAESAVDEGAQPLQDVLGLLCDPLGQSLSELLQTPVSAELIDFERRSPGVMPEDAVIFTLGIRIEDASFSDSLLAIATGAASDAVELLAAAAGLSEPAAAGHGKTATMGTFRAGVTEGMRRAEVRPVHFDSLRPDEHGSKSASLDLLLDVPLRLTVELGRAGLEVRELIRLKTGQVIELDKPAGEPLDILVNGRPVAKGEIVVIDDHFGVRITEILSPNERAAHFQDDGRLR